MSSYAELHQQQGGLHASGSRHGYADRYLQQQEEAASRRSYSGTQQQQSAEASSRRSYSTEQYRVVVSSMDEGFTRQPSSVLSPSRQVQGYAAIAAAAAATATETGDVCSPPRKNKGTGNSGSPSPKHRLDPSVSRPATTVLAQATALRAVRLKQLAQRQQQVQQPPPAQLPDVVRRPGRQQVVLSAVLQQAPHLYDRQRLSVVERFIERIDAVPMRYSEAQVIFLSKNSLSSVAGLEQFRQLRVLGLADNLIADLEQLEALAAACQGLEALSLEGNPIAYVPHYRSRVLLALPGLKSLDGRPITEEERGAAPASIAAEEATMAVLLRNACEVHKMASVVQRAQMHMELLHVMYSKGAVLRRVEALGDAATATGGRSLSRLVDLWDYEALLGMEVRQGVAAHLEFGSGSADFFAKITQWRHVPGWARHFMGATIGSICAANRVPLLQAHLS